MFKRIVIASDSFKGSLSSSEVAMAAAEGVRKVCPGCETRCIQIADGGEGTAKALLEAYTTKAVRIETVQASVHDPLGRPMTAEYHIMNGETAIMEMAAASGLTLLVPEERNPLKTSTFGTGEMISDAIGKGCRRFIIGIGGSATNDGGTGMLEALGVRFLDKNGEVIKGLCGKFLTEVADIDCTQMLPELKDSEFTIACDVDTPFCGQEGAARIFAVQKGADEHDTGILEEGMQSLCSIIREKTGIDLSHTSGSGAAGGLGGAFHAFLGASLSKGIDLILDACGFSEAIKDADLVITGEGRIDGQTSKGKVISGITGKAQGTPVIAIAGIVDISPKEATTLGLSGVYPTGPRPQTESDLRNAMRPEVASENITRTVATALESLFPSSFRESL